jgi:hypothetical protein
MRLVLAVAMESDVGDPREHAEWFLSIATGNP